MVFGWFYSRHLLQQLQDRLSERTFNYKDQTSFPVNFNVTESAHGHTICQLDTVYANYHSLLGGCIEEKEFRAVIDGANQLLQREFRSTLGTTSAYVCCLCTLGFSTLYFYRTAEALALALEQYWQEVQARYNVPGREVNWDFATPYGGLLLLPVFRVPADNAHKLAQIRALRRPKRASYSYSGSASVSIEIPPLASNSPSSSPSSDPQPSIPRGPLPPLVPQGSVNVING